MTAATSAASRYQVDQAADSLAALSRRAASVALSRHHQPVRRNRAARHRRLLRHRRFRAAARLPGAAPIASPGARRQPSPLSGMRGSRIRVRLGVRFLMRANRMDALYGEEVGGPTAWASARPACTNGPGCGSA